jgi:hypothetical protein
MMDNMQLDEVNCREWCVAVRQTRGLTGLVLMGGAGGRKITAVSGPGVVVFGRVFVWRACSMFLCCVIDPWFVCCSTCPTASSASTSSPVALSSSKCAMEIGV